MSTAIELHGERLYRCKDCKAPIIWLKTAAGANMPADAETVGVGDQQFDRTKHVSHFGTCPNAAKFRRPKVSKGK